MKSNLIVLLIVGLCVLSCSNDEVVPKDQLQTNIASRSQDSILNFMPQDQIDLISANFLPDCSDHVSILGQITMLDGVLNFNNLIHFENCIQCLEDLLEGHLNSFEQSNSGLSAEELDSLGDSIGFRYFKPLEDFEASMGFNSRRALIESEILDWLDVDSELLDWQSNPDDWDDFSEEERTLMTQSGLVSINGNLINMLQLDNNYAQMSSSSCYYRKKSKDPDWYYKTGSEDRVAKVKLKNTSYPWKVKIKSKIVHYKRKRRRFRRRRENMRTSCAGVITFQSCGIASEHGDAAGYKKRRSRKAKSVDWGSEAWYKHEKDNQWGMFCVQNESQCKALNH